MAESKINDSSYYQICGWMVNRLGLKGAPLKIYAIIYGFSQDGESSFTGSLQYLSDFTNASRPTVIKALKELVDKGYVMKHESIVNGVQFNTYKADLQVVKKLYWGSKETLLGGSKESLLGGSKETLPNNKALNNKGVNNIVIPYDRIAAMYNEICVSLPHCKALSDKRRKAIKARIMSGYTEDDFKTLFTAAEASSFLKGAGDRSWRATFDWLIKEDNIVKVLEGTYADKPRREVVPGWMKKGEVSDFERDAVKRLMEDAPKTVGTSPELADRAEKLKQSLKN